VIVFVSKEYAEKVWTKHEIRNVFERDLHKGDDYLIPALFDDTKITGLRTTIGAIDLREVTPHAFVEIIAQKLGINV
jgi:hypothetical protein